MFRVVRDILSWTQTPFRHLVASFSAYTAASQSRDSEMSNSQWWISIHVLVKALDIVATCFESSSTTSCLRHNIEARVEDRLAVAS